VNTQQLRSPAQRATPEQLSALAPLSALSAERLREPAEVALVERGVRGSDPLAPLADSGPSREYIVYCQSGRRSSAAAFLFAQLGFRVSLLRGDCGPLAVAASPPRGDAVPEKLVKNHGNGC
jgi:hypothetical protein